MKHLAKYFKPYIIWFFVLIAFAFGETYANLALPDYMSKIINEGIVFKNLDKIWSNGATMLLITVIGGVCATLVGYFASRVSSGFAKKIREAVFMNIERFSLAEFDKFSSSSLITRTTNDIQQIQNVMSMFLKMALFAPIMGIGSVIKAYKIAPTMSWVVVGAVGSMLAMVVVLFIVVIPKFTKIQSIVDKISLLVREMLTGVRVIRAYGNDEKQQKKFDKTNLESTKLNIFVNRVMMIINPVMTLVLGLSTVAVIWIGAYLVNDHSIQPGNLLALMQYVSQTIIAFLLISIVFVMVPRAIVSAKRVNEILATKSSIKDPKKPQILPEKIKGIIEFNDVDFAYGNSEEKVLSDISFKAMPGQTTAIIGGTGSGKSSIINLIPRLYDVTSGSITIDGIDIRKVSQNDLRKHIGYVPQKPALLSGTIAENVTYGRPEADKKDIDKALDISQSSDFVNKLPDKIDSEMAQAGSNISGGQKQRLSIARVLAKKPEIYLFDDSFSALDFKTDNILRKALKKEVSGATMIIVAQRISTIMHADQIIVIDDGKVVGIGTHSELLKRSSVYREIAQSQLSAAEIAEEF